MSPPRSRKTAQRGSTNGATKFDDRVQETDIIDKHGITTRPLRESAWAVRGVSAETQNAARLAARRAGLTIGEWVDQTLRAAAMGELRGPTVPAPTQEDTLKAILTQLEKRDREAAETADAVAKLTNEVARLRDRRSWLSKLFQR